MKKYIIIFFAGLILLMCGCQPSDDHLDRVKQFKPEDKYFKASLVSLHFIIETSTIGRIDTLFSQILGGNELPVTAVGCVDGTYTGESPYDAYDYKHVVTIRIQNEQIIAVDYDEVKKDGKGKQADTAYGEEMRASGTTPGIAYPQMEAQLLEKQDALQLNAVTGATYSLYRFRYALIIALINARLAAK